jgi:hypothetical protein
MDMLVEYEMDMQMEETKTEEAHIAKSNTKVSKHHSRRSNSDSEAGMVIECYLCDGDHAFRFCDHVKLAGKLLKRYLRKQKDTEYSGKKTSSGAPWKKLTSKPHGYPETGSTSDNNSDISLNSSSSDDDDDDGILEVCNLSHDDISKVAPFSCAADTGAFLHMSGQPSICKQMIPINRQQIQVKGGDLYSDVKGTVDLKCKDDSSMVLRNVLFMHKLGANLLSARRLCEAGLVRFFNLGKMYSKLDGKTAIKATIENGRYIVNHNSKHYRETAFPCIDYDMRDSVRSDSEITQNPKELGTKEVPK